MTYRKKVKFLSAVIMCLTLIYVLSFVFDQSRRQDRAFAWLDTNLHHLADRIEITGPDGSTTVLIRRHNVWVLGAFGNEFPVRQQRVQDLFAALSRRDTYTLRSTSLEARHNLGLSIGDASRILVRGGLGLPLLDLLIGIASPVGRELYMARADEREIYSGEDRFTIFTDSGPLFWLDFRLFGENRPGFPGLIETPVEISMVQQAAVFFAPAGEEAFSYTLIRSGGGWLLQGDENAGLINPRVEAWLRSVLEAEADDFAAREPEYFEGQITLWLGDGTTRTVNLGPPEEGAPSYRSAVVPGSPLVHILSQGTISRLFRDSSDFLR